MRIVTTLDNKTVCNVIMWPPKQNVAGNWELKVYGCPSVFDLLGDYRGCNFLVEDIEFEYLVFIERKIMPAEDEMETATMIFASACLERQYNNPCAVKERGEAWHQKVRL